MYLRGCYEGASALSHRHTLGSFGGWGVQRGRAHSQDKKRSHKAVPGPTWDQSRQEHRESWVGPPLGRGKVEEEPQGRGRQEQLRWSVQANRQMQERVSYAPGAYAGNSN